LCDRIHGGKHAPARENEAWAVCHANAVSQAETFG
jgi:hypothetical protein